MCVCVYILQVRKFHIERFPLDFFFFKKKTNTPAIGRKRIMELFQHLPTRYGELPMAQLKEREAMAASASS